MIVVRENYNSFDYWENVISRNKTIRGHVFMQKPPTDKCLYFHTLIFSKKNGISNMWGYFPNIRSLLGYIQYSFLQEGFYKWIHGRDSLITRIPSISVDKIIKDAEKAKKVTKEVAENMKKDYETLKKIWDMPTKKAEIELRKFIIEFNKRWIGDNKEFLYIKVFRSPEEVGEFVISSGLITSTKQELESRIGMKIEAWKEICRESIHDAEKGEIFRYVLSKKLSEVL